MAEPSEASCGYEFNRQTRDVFKQNLEPRDALCFLNEQPPNVAIYDTPDANENCRTSEMNAKRAPSPTGERSSQTLKQVGRGLR